MAKYLKLTLCSIYDPGEIVYVAESKIFNFLSLKGVDHTRSKKFTRIVTAENAYVDVIETPEEIFELLTNNEIEK